MQAVVCVLSGLVCGPVRGPGFVQKDRRRMRVSGHLDGLWRSLRVSGHLDRAEGKVEDKGFFMTDE